MPAHLGGLPLAKTHARQNLLPWAGTLRQAASCPDVVVCALMSVAVALNAAEECESSRTGFERLMGSAARSLANSYERAWINLLAQCRDGNI